MTQEQAISIMKTGASVFLTGEPGSGKSHTVNTYVSYLRSHDIEPSITASTGIAATHIGGSTIHSWSGIGIARELTKKDYKRIIDGPAGRRIKSAKVLIIDEISMIDATTLDNVEEVCSAVRGGDAPFGGLQVVLVGDFFQLPPISSSAGGARFAYDADSWTRLSPTICYLDEQHRQEDEDFLRVLSAIRSGQVDQHHVDHLAGRIVTDVQQYKSITKLYSHNANVDHINSVELANLTGDEQLYEMSTTGPEKLVVGLVKSCISPAELRLKTGATVMFTKNSPKDGFVNGTLGKVTGFDVEVGKVTVKTIKGRTIDVGQMDWMIEENGVIKAKVSQIPLRLAWAITIHKSQGMSLDAAIVDLRSVFEYGQGYVALSRVRSLAGLYLLGYNERSLMVHPEILTHDQKFRADSQASILHCTSKEPAEVERLCHHFILSCDGNITTQVVKAPKPKRKKVKGDTLEVTLALVRAHKSIADIAQERELTETTIISHIEKLIGQNKLAVSDILPHINPQFRAALPEIHLVFRTFDTTSLTPVYEYFKGRYTYRDLQVARMLIV